MNKDTGEILNDEFRNDNLFDELDIEYKRLDEDTEEFEYNRLFAQNDIEYTPLLSDHD